MLRTFALIAVAALAACGDDPLAYQGVPGQPIPAAFESSVPAITASVDGVPGRFLIDTGAPLSFVDTDSYPAYQDGSHDADLDAFALRVPAFTVFAFDVFAFEDAAHDGILGGDLLRHFALGVDYRGEQVWVDDPDLGVTAHPAGADPGELAPTLAVDVDVAGGGGALIPGECPGGCGAVDLDATRVVVEATLEGRAEPIALVVDTGASALVLRPSVVDELGDPSRPRLDGVTVGTANGAVTAYLTRVGALAVDAVLDDASAAAGALVETSVSTLVLPDEAIFDGLSAEVGRRVDGLLGGSFLRAFAISIDYPGHTLRASRYLVRDHIDPNEFVRVGFTMVPDGEAWRVQDVHPGTDADAQDIVPGDEIASVDGVAIAGADADAVSALFTAFGLGDRVPLEVLRGVAGAPVALDVLVEDLLPNYEGP